MSILTCENMNRIIGPPKSRSCQGPLSTPPPPPLPSPPSLFPPISQVTFTKQPYNNLRKKFPYLTKNGFDLLNRFLTYDPARRITAEQALDHPYLKVRGQYGCGPAAVTSSWLAGGATACGPLHVPDLARQEREDQQREGAGEEPHSARGRGFLQAGEHPTFTARCSLTADPAPPPPSQDDEDSQGFRMTLAKQGQSAGGPGFQLKF